jgi:hypothetical protein
VAAFVVAVLMVMDSLPAGAQTPDERIQNAPDGRIRMTFAARPGVCGDGENILTGRGRGEDSDWECLPGPVRLVLTKEAGEIVRVRTYVGGRWREGATSFDLGTVSAPGAAAFLTDLAEHGQGRAARDAIMPATLADSAVVWPALVRVARNEDRPRRNRQAALRWVGMAAGQAVLERVGPVTVEDRDADARERAVFAMSQLPRDESVPALIDIARSHRDPRIRKTALFWLGQTEDPRAIDVLEEVLQGG